MDGLIGDSITIIVFSITPFYLTLIRWLTCTPPAILTELYISTGFRLGTGSRQDIFVYSTVTIIIFSITELSIPHPKDSI